jgi:phosphatidylglycerophosphate synthase
VSATLWIARSEGDVDPETPLLGLTLLRRAVLAGERAGFSRIVVEPENEGRAATNVTATRAEPLRDGDPAPALGSGRIVVLSPSVIAEKKWLKELRQMPVEMGVLEVDPGCAAVLETGDLAEAENVLRARRGEDAIEALAKRFPRAASELSSRDRFSIGGPADLRPAERWMLARLIKDNEGFMSRHVERKISLAISRRLAPTAVTPNQMTLISVGFGIAGAALFLSANRWAPLVGALLVLTHSILDGCDGELARLKFQESRFGGVLDFWGDNVVHSAVFAAIAVAWARAVGEAWPLLLGASAVLGTLLSAGFVYRSTMAGVKEGPLFTSVSQSPDSLFSRVVDALARRDFLYLLVILAAFHRERLFLVLSAAGSPIYFLLLVGLARAERRKSAAPARAGSAAG